MGGRRGASANRRCQRGVRAALRGLSRPLGARPGRSPDKRLRTWPRARLNTPLDTSRCQKLRHARGDLFPVLEMGTVLAGEYQPIDGAPGMSLDLLQLQ